MQLVDRFHVQCFSRKSVASCKTFIFLALNDPMCPDVSSVCLWTTPCHKTISIGRSTHSLLHRAVVHPILHCMCTVSNITGTLTRQRLPSVPCNHHPHSPWALFINRRWEHFLSVENATESSDKLCPVCTSTDVVVKYNTS